MMLVFVRINDVVVEAGDVFLSHRFQKFQELDVSPAPHGLARHECRRNALDGREQRAKIGEDRALRLQRIELLQRDAQRAGLFFKQLVVPRLITGMARQRKLCVELRRTAHPLRGNDGGFHFILQRHFQERRERRHRCSAPFQSRPAKHRRNIELGEQEIVLATKLLDEFFSVHRPLGR